MASMEVDHPPVPSTSNETNQDQDMKEEEETERLSYKAVSLCRAKLSKDIENSLDDFLKNSPEDLLTEQDKDMVLYQRDKKNSAIAVGDMFDLILAKDGIVGNLMDALIKSCLFQSCEALKNAVEQTKAADEDYRKRLVDYTQASGVLPKNQNSVIDTDDDENEITLPVPVRAVKKCQEQLMGDLTDKYPAFMGHLTCLSDTDKDAVHHVERLRGPGPGLREALCLMLDKYEFFDDLTRALEKCSLHETVSVLNHAVKVENGIETEYTEKLAAYEVTQDPSDLKKLAGENAGFKRKQMDVQNFIPRKYQTELATKAMEGENCLICAPTNSGKTFVSTMISDHHLKTYNPGNHNNRKPCVLFLVPRLALLQQIYTQYKIHLPLNNIGKMSGSSPARMKLSSLLKDDHVIVVTPQILLNGLVDKSVKFADFSLLILDECHNATKESPYNKIMEMYIRSKGVGRVREGYPQVVGLTASPGAGRITKLCANIDSHHFVTVKDHLQELNAFINESNRTVLPANEREANPFEGHINDYMHQLEKYISMSWMGDRSAQEYINHVNLLKDRYIKNTGADRDKVVYCDHLIKIHEALCLSKEVRLEDGMTFLSQVLELMQKPMMLDFEDELIDKFTELLRKLQPYKEWEELYPNPKLVMVKEIILRSKNECDKKNMMEFRAMIHSKTRQTTLALYSWMQSDPELSKLNTHYLTGIHASVDEGGLTPDFTKRILQQFDEGKVKVLVCTSVGEEGLNIVACRLIIRYNHVTNEISMIQARGRIRAKDGTEVVIGGNTVVAKDQTNVALERDMKEDMEIITKMDPAQFRRDVEAIQREAIRKVETQELLVRQTFNLHITWFTGTNLHCGHCDVFACPLSEIRTERECNHINPLKSFADEKINFFLYEHPHKWADGKIFCKNCGHDWGTIIDTFPCLKIAAFIVIKGENDRRSVKQWKIINKSYKIPPLRRDDEYLTAEKAVEN